MLLMDERYFVYIITNYENTVLYTGITNNLQKRIEEHKKGMSFSTKFRLPFELAYFEGCKNIEDAKRRENYLKTTQGRRFLGLRLQEHKRHKTAFGSGS